MRGHEAIIAMRQAGKRPAFVFVNDWPCATDWHLHGDHATVSTDGDVIQLLDMRYLVGLRVSISSENETRAKALLDKCKASGASVVAAVHVLKNAKPWMQSGWSEVWIKEQETVHGR